MKYRPHRGSYKSSMYLERDVKTLGDLERVCGGPVWLDDHWTVDMRDERLTLYVLSKDGVEGMLCFPKQ